MGVHEVGKMDQRPRGLCFSFLLLADFLFFFNVCVCFFWFGLFNHIFLSHKNRICLTYFVTNNCIQSFLNTKNISSSCICVKYLFFSCFLHQYYSRYCYFLFSRTFFIISRGIIRCNLTICWKKL